MNRRRFISAVGATRYRSVGLRVAAALVVSSLILVTEAHPQRKARAVNIIDLSRDSAVEIRTGDQRLGSGFLISDRHVATAFHVISTAVSTPKGVVITYRPDLKVKLSDGEVVDADCVTQATDADPSPLNQDFAVLRLRGTPKSRYQTVKLADANERPSVGEEIVFSGYPLDAPGMVTRKGMVSGANDSRNVIFLQAPVNKGNSGGAVLTADGKPVGIISFREGGISKGLQEVQQRIKQAEEAKDVQTRIRMGPVDPIQSTREIIATLDRYISTGIWYALSIKFLRKYLAEHPALLQK